MTLSAPVVDSAPDVRRAGFRPDIQVLRAIAVSAVLVYHAGLAFAPGGFVGVDVFFVVSGFLITNHLLAELGSTGALRFGRFYARRARRILPAALVVIGLTAVAVVAVLPRSLQPATLFDAAASAVYGPNLRFAVQGVDYLAEAAPSPYQHYWSLGVEEQFYAFWPLILVGLWAVTRGSTRRLLAALALLVAASFGLGLILTYRAQPLAFFLLPTRAWELGVGALLAVAGPVLLQRLRPRIGTALGWIGVVMIVTTVLLLRESVAFPGWAAAVPVAGTALVIAGGTVAGPRSAGSVLGRPVVLAVGAVSYSLYLVHWPLLVLPQLANGQGEPLPLPIRLGLLIATVPLAVLLWRVVEQPFLTVPRIRALPPRIVLVGALGCSLVLATLTAAAGVAIRQLPLASGRSAPAARLVPGQPPDFTRFVPDNLQPSLHDVATDLPRSYADGCHLPYAEEQTPSHCSYGDVGSHRSVVLFGDSHAAQWLPALEPIASAQGLRLDVFTKSSCPSVLVTMVTDGVRDTGCDRWREAVLRRLSADPPDRIVISNFSHYASYGAPGVDETAWAEGLTALLDRLPQRTEVTLISDTPEFPSSPAVCLSAHLDEALACARPRTQALAQDWIASEARTATAAGAQVVSVDDLLCDDRCGVVIGSTLVYRDRHHLSTVLVRELVPVLTDRLAW